MYEDKREVVVDVKGVTFRVEVVTEITSPDWWEGAVYVDDSERDILPLIEGAPLHENIIQAVAMAITTGAYT